MLQKLSELNHLRVEWSQPRTLDRYFELHAGGVLLSTLTFRSAWGTLATAESGEGRWSFKRVGFLNPRLTIRVNDQEPDLAIYQPKFWGDGVLTFTNGESFAWKPVNFWSTEWAFINSAGQRVLHFMPGIEDQKLTDLFKTQVTVELEALTPGRELLPILLPLGMYLIILHNDDTAAAAAAT
jgi:hypothetical protein